MFVVQDKETMQVVDVFGAEHEFKDWWDEQDSPQEKYTVIYHRNVQVSIKQMVTNV